ncbi:MAG: YkgJ family cysteine cluster protein [Myxococcaceae bacterium]|nr:YkgJ family cysteine cluster protein [Myxococcaceae bacterium]
MRHDEDEHELPEPVKRKRVLAETREVLRAASEAYARWSCPSTAECCQLATTGRPPWLWPSEWALITEHLHRARRPLPPRRADGGCPFLDEAGARCTIYEVRPFGCRTFFCHRVKGPAQQPTRATNDLLAQLAGANLAWRDDAEAKPLPDWHAAAAPGTGG